MTQTIYKPTTIQKLLGRNYKWWYLIKETANSARLSISTGLFVQGANIIQTVAIYYIWYLGHASNEVLTYLVISRIYKEMSNDYCFEPLGNAIINGKVTNELLFPQNFIFYNFVRSFGNRVILNFSGAVTMIIAAILTVSTFTPIQLHFQSALILVFFLPISYVIQHLCSVLFGCIAFFLEDKRNFSGIVRVYHMVIGSILTGILIPLDKLPFSTFLSSTPFAFMAFQPMQIYLGKYSTLETFYVFLGGLTWCFTLYFLAKWVFKMGLKKNEAVGL